MITRRIFMAQGSAALLSGVSASSYSVSILGDTHFDASPLDVYHGKWKPRDEQDWKDRQGEFKRNVAMWTSGRVPRLIAAAAKVRRSDAAFLLHMGDLIQGDCTDTEVYRRFFADAKSVCTKGFGDLPFVVVCGNHDIRGGGEKSFDEFACPLYSQVAHRSVDTSNFMIKHGDDAWLFLDFMRPDPAKTFAMLEESKGARWTILCSHGAVAPTDTWGPYWFLFGEPELTKERRELFRLLLDRKAVFLCGHLHKTQIRRWRRGAGELVEFCANSVWRQAVDVPKTLYDKPEQFGSYVRKHPSRMNEDYDGRKQTRTAAQLVSLCDEYVSGLHEYRMLAAAGHYILRVNPDAIAMDFYLNDGTLPRETFVLAKRG